MTSNAGDWLLLIGWGLGDKLLYVFQSEAIVLIIYYREGNCVYLQNFVIFSNWWKEITPDIAILNSKALSSTVAAMLLLDYSMS